MGRQQAKFFDDARGSAIECAACLDASVAKGFVFLERIQSGKEMLVRIVAMLTKLVVRFDPNQYSSSSSFSIAPKICSLVSTWLGGRLASRHPAAVGRSSC